MHCLLFLFVQSLRNSGSNSMKSELPTGHGAVMEPVPDDDLLDNPTIGKNFHQQFTSETSPTSRSFCSPPDPDDVTLVLRPSELTRLSSPFDHHTPSLRPKHLEHSSTLFHILSLARSSRQARYPRRSPAFTEASRILPSRCHHSTLRHIIEASRCIHPPHHRLFPLHPRGSLPMSPDMI